MEMVNKYIAAEWLPEHGYDDEEEVKNEQVKVPSADDHTIPNEPSSEPYNGKGMV